MIHLAVEQVGLLDGLDVYFSLNPVSALFRDTLLLELVGQLQPIGVNNEGLLLRLAGVEPVDEGGLAEQEIEVVDAVEAVLQCVVGVDGEVGGDDREPRAVANDTSEEISNDAARVIVTYS